MSVNRVCLTGNLGTDPDVRQTASGMAVMSFRLAVNERRKNSRTGNWDDYTNWVGVSMFGTRAQALAQFLHKGSKVGIDGHLRYSEWERDGQKRSKLEVIADDIEPLTPKQQPQQQPQYVEATLYEQPQQAMYDEQIPF